MFQEEVLALLSRGNLEGQINTSTCYTSNKDCFIDCSLRVEMTQPNLINKNPIKTSILIFLEWRRLLEPIDLFAHPQKLKSQVSGPWLLN
jgi:hypothetical protein